MAPSNKPYTPNSISYSYIDRYGNKVTGTHYGSTNSTLTK